MPVNSCKTAQITSFCTNYIRSFFIAYQNSLGLSRGCKLTTEPTSCLSFLTSFECLDPNPECQKCILQQHLISYNYANLINGEKTLALSFYNSAFWIRRMDPTLKQAMIFFKKAMILQGMAEKIQIINTHLRRSIFGSGGN